MNDPYASEAETKALLQRDTRTPAEKNLDQMLDERWANEQGVDAVGVLRQIAIELIAQQAEAVPLHQILTDPENQPNQYGVEFLMRGQKFAFKVGTQQFTLDYEPTEPGEFEFMRDMLIHAFSTFTPDVKTAQAVPLLSDEEVDSVWDAIPQTQFWWRRYARAIEQAVRAKMGVAVPMTLEQIIRMTDEIPLRDGCYVQVARVVEKFHGIVGKEGA